MAKKSTFFALTLLITGTALARPALPLPMEPRRPDPSEPMAVADMGPTEADAGTPDGELDAGPMIATDAGTPPAPDAGAALPDASATPIDAATPVDAWVSADAAHLDAGDVDAETMIDTPRPPTSDVFTTDADRSACSVVIAHRGAMPLSVAFALLLVLFALRHRRERR